jgi:hypothetical protein
MGPRLDSLLANYQPRVGFSEDAPQGAPFCSAARRAPQIELGASPVLPGNTDERE